MPNRTAPTFMQSKSGFFRVIATNAVALLEKITAAIERRRIRAALSKLDDYMLKDMGIARPTLKGLPTVPIHRASNHRLRDSFVPHDQLKGRLK